MEDEFEAPRKGLRTCYNQLIYRTQICGLLISNTGFNGVISPAVEFFENASISDKIKAIKPHFNWSPLDSDVLINYQKHKDISGEFRRVAGFYYDEGNFFEAVRFYNMAILYGEKDGPELKLAYACRTTALSCLSKAQEAKRCEPKPKSASSKVRSTSSSSPTDEGPTPEKNQSPSPKPSIMKAGQCDDLEARNLFYRNMFTLSSPNPIAPSLAESIDIDIESNQSPRGRRLVANKSIPVGATVLLERPFAAVLTNALAWDVNHCHHCFKKNIENLPCDNCVFTLYCSDDCREKARDYHQYECECLPELHCALDDALWRSKFHLAFKLVCQLGPKALFKQFKERKPGDPMGVFVAVQTQTKQVIAEVDRKTGIPESDFNKTPTHMLMSRNIPEKGHYFILAALTLVRTLLETDFSSAVPYNNKTDEEPEFQDFLAEFILCHFEAFWINALELHDFPEYGRTTFRTQKSGTKGLLENIENSVTGIFPSASLVNHSCVENVAIINGKSDGLMALIAIKPIVSGEEIFISYNQRYNRDPFVEARDRRTALKTHFNFYCDCIACENDWRPINYLFANELSNLLDFCCPKCSSTFQHEKKESSEFFKCKLIGAGDIKCSECGASYVLATQRDEYIKMRDILIKYKADLQNKEPPSQHSVNTTPDGIKEVLMFFETSVCPPNYYCLLASELYKCFVNLILIHADPKLK